MNSSLTSAQQEIREGVDKVCTRFGDDYWLERDTDGEFPHAFHKALSRGGLARHRHAGGLWRVGARHHGSGDHDADDRPIGCGLLRRLGGAHEHLRAQPRGGVRHRGAEAPLPAAADRRQGEVLLCRHGARRRPRHHAPQDAGREARQRLCHPRAEDLDLDRAGGRPRAAARPHHAARGGEEAHRGSLALLYGARSQVRGGPRHRQDGPQGRGLQPAVLRRHAGAARGPHRRGGQGLRVHPARHEPRADTHCGRGGGRGPRGAGARHALRQGAHRVRPADRAEPGRSSTRSRGAGWSSRRRT